MFCMISYVLCLLITCVVCLLLEIHEHSMRITTIQLSIISNQLANDADVLGAFSRRYVGEGPSASRDHEFKQSYTLRYDLSIVSDKLLFTCGHHVVICVQCLQPLYSLFQLKKSPGIWRPTASALILFNVPPCFLSDQPQLQSEWW